MDFIKKPLKVHVVSMFDPQHASSQRLSASSMMEASSEIRKTYVFLGGAPPAVFKAAQSGNSDVLAAFYSASYKRILGINVAKINVSGSHIGGTEEFNESDLKLLEDNDANKSESADFTKILEDAGDNASKFDIKDNGSGDSSLVFTRQQCFPEDKLFDIRQKIFVATRIPIYRQHLFYYKHGALCNMYKMLSNGNVNIDILEASAYKSATPTLNGLPIDKSLHELKDEIKIESMEQFKLARDELVDSTIYVVDLGAIISSRFSAIIELMRDQYQRELFYYGFIIKYWPLLSLEAFIDLISGNDFESKYPELAPSHTLMKNIFEAEQEIASRAATAPQATFMAITSVSATTRGEKILINLRNLFDHLHVTKLAPEIHLYLNYENRKYFIRKRHAYIRSTIKFPQLLSMKQGIIIALRVDSMKQTLDGEIKVQNYIFLNINSNGKYIIKSTWEVEDQKDFETLFALMKKYTDPVIAGINSLGKYVFPTNGKLKQITKENIIYQNLNVSVVWRKILSDSSYKIFKAASDMFLRAGITSPRNVQQFNYYEFLFRKGMHDFDTSNIERILTASNKVLLNNYYFYLTNNTVKQKWDQNYGGRIVRMYHRITDIKFDIFNVSKEEYEIFNRYINALVAMSKSDIAAAKSTSGPEARRLKKLREQDPELFNLKKHGSSKVYSILCQNRRQPLIYTDEEVALTSAAERAKLAKYWNFTYKRPAYYSCPHRDYPYLSFTTDAHPLHYCLPCCKKEPGEASKKSAVNEICLSKHKFIQGDEALGRHIMSYGRQLESGRLSRLPQNLSDVFKNFPLYCFGVAQHFPGASYAGAINAIAFAAGLTIEVIVNKFISKLTPKSFESLLNGTIINYFTHDIFVNTLISTFVKAEPTVISFDDWDGVFKEIAECMGYSICTFCDYTGEGAEIKMKTKIDNNDLTSGDGGTTANNLHGEYILLMQIGREYYPMVLIDEDYHKSNKIAAKIFSKGDAVVAKLAEVIKFDARVNKIFNIEHFKKRKIPIRKQHVNKSGLTYALEVEFETHVILCPIFYTRVDSKIPQQHEPADIKCPHDIAIKFASKVQLTPVNYIVDEGTIIGIEMNFTGVKSYHIPLIIRIDPISAALAPTKLPPRYLKDPFILNSALILGSSTPGTDFTKKIATGLYNNYQYQLFVIEFVNYIGNEKNTEIRKELARRIAADEMKGEQNRKFISWIKSVMSDEDRMLIQACLNDYFYDHFDPSLLLERVLALNYKFDHKTLEKIRSETASNAIAELTQIANRLCVEQNISIGTFGNVYFPCANVEAEYCRDKKLIVANIPIFVDMLYRDLKDEIKSSYFFNNLFTENIINYFKFEQKPTEIITIYLLS